MNAVTGRTLRYIAPTGNLGAGFTEEYFNAALDRDIMFVGCDAGSCDGGPSYLAQNGHFGSRAGVKRDLAIMLRGTRRLGIPLLIGSAGGSGGNWNVDWVCDIVLEIAHEEALAPFHLARIYAEVPREELLRRYREGSVAPLDPAPPLDEDRIEGAIRIVAMMGADAFQKALSEGADVVIAGRATDASIFAAIPLTEGFPPGLVWHAAKIMECGGAAVAQMDRPEGMICTLYEDRFELEPVSPHQRCTRTSVASHALYETGDPYEMREPSGTLKLYDARYEAVDDRTVSVSGSGFAKEPYTVRLEGAELAGYRAIVIGGIRDTVLLAQLDPFLEECRQRIEEHVSLMDGGAGEPYTMSFRCYGRDGVLGEREPLRDRVGHEVGLLINVIASSQERANAIAGFAGHRILHQAVPEWSGLVSNLAFPLAPHFTPCGPAFRFMLNHVIALDDPLELFPMTLEPVSA